ncbi:MAG: acyl-CoA dehydrogenase, partial [Thermoplasmata archaeon]|nr:acyl-CoA dehydrogenase [Thermoplasmata archaeon]NIW88284.1 acyl-CoA dehydrogenase [Thermoplasmata archaeon]
MVRNAVRSFAEDVLGPGVQERDELEEYPSDLVEAMAELNLFGLTCPPEYGGAGSDTVSYAISIEELSRVDPSVGVSLAVHNSVATYPILYHGTDEQKERWLPELSTGKRIGAFCLSEAQA